MCLSVGDLHYCSTAKECRQASFWSVFHLIDTRHSCHRQGHCCAWYTAWYRRGDGRNARGFLDPLLYCGFFRWINGPHLPVFVWVPRASGGHQQLCKIGRHGRFCTWQCKATLVLSVFQHPGVEIATTRFKIELGCCATVSHSVHILAMSISVALHMQAAFVSAD